MHRDRRLAVITRAFALVAVFVAFSSPFAGSASAADKTDIQLRLSLESSGKGIITVFPAEAKIWRNKPDKPKKINWTTVNGGPYEDVFWELRYDPSKGGGSENYFGDVDIECGETDKKVQPEKKPDFPSAQWPYSVTVYACADGVKAQKVTTLDPRIVWKD